MTIQFLAKLVSKDYGMDLGTANTVVTNKKGEIIMNEPSVVAINAKTKKVVNDGDGCGIVAKNMIGKFGSNLEVIRPLKNGAVTNIEATSDLIRYFIRKLQKTKLDKLFGCNRMVIAVPSGGTEVEKRAVITAAERAGVNKVYLVPQPIASALGAGLNISEPMGSMIVDIGGGTSEIGIISLADMVVNHSVKFGGDAFDEAIIDYVKDKFKLNIGYATAEKVKMSIGSCVALDEELEMKIGGLSKNGLPTKVLVTSEDIREAIHHPINEIIRAIRYAIEQSPPEIAADLVDNGVMLAGGGSLIRGLDQRISEETHLSVYRAENPMLCVALGTGVILSQLDILAAILSTY
jgi:rod shape-determining protein MreB